MTKPKNENKKLDHVMEIIQNQSEDKNKTDAMALYYAYSKHVWEGNLSKLHIADAAKYLSISADRVRKARRILIELNIVVPRTINNEEGIFHLVELKE